jgi:hypothetical protein
MKTADEKWMEVKTFYESNYEVEFTYRLAQAKVEFLYEQMLILSRSLDRHERVARGFLIRIGASTRAK